MTRIKRAPILSYAPEPGRVQHCRSRTRSRLARLPRRPEPRAAAAGVRRVGDPAHDPAEAAAAGVAAAPLDALDGARPRLAGRPIGGRARVGLVVNVLDPLPDVPEDVVEPERVRPELPDRSVED